MKKDEKPEVDRASLYSLVIYQNDQFVDGLYQSMYGGRIDAREETVARDSKTSGDIELNLSASVPLVAKGSVAGTGEMERGRSARVSQTMSFSQSYYLHKVREKLYEEQILKRLDGEGDFDSVGVGSFVEFQATFETNDLVSALDLVTPELGEVIGFSNYAKKITSNDEYVQAHATAQSALGKSIVDSLQKEFRNETTSEYYGRLVGESGPSNERVGAVLICDKEFFANSDSDRLLDGEFTVVGKVIAKSEDGFSKFERNKLLKRITKAGVVELVMKIAELGTVSQYFDTNIEFDFSGRVVKVIPVAIYA